MKLRLLLYYLFIQIFVSNDFVYAQDYCFSRINGIDLKGGYLGFASWCDYNSDGKMDIFVTGEDFGGDFQHAMIYKNNGDNTFSESNVNNIPRVIYGSLSWGDYNNDGNIDLLYSGTKSGMSADNITKIYQNDGNGNFTDINTPLIQVNKGSVEWVDIDNDGKLDVFALGTNNQDQIDLAVYKNKGDNSFEKKDVSFAKVFGKRTNFNKCLAKWADFDNDGLKDVVIAMGCASDFSFKCYKNLGNFNFQEVNIGLPKLNYVTMAIGDLNQDGFIDLVYTGSPSQELYGPQANNLTILLNKGNMKFEDAQSNLSVGVFWNTMDIADYTNDGYPDIVYHGSRNNSEINIYKNNKNNTFSYTFNYVLDCEEGGSLFGDVDNNNVLDLLHYGRMKYPNDFEATYVYKNTIGTSNLKPGPPTEIKLNAVKNDLCFMWNSGTDDSTKTNGLYYNIRIGTKTNPDSIISSNSTDSKLKYYHLGNMNKNKTLVFKDFPEGHFTVNVQSIDNSFNVSRFSDGYDFCFKHPIGLFSDTIRICKGDSIKLDTGDGYFSYEWNTGQNTKAIFAKNEGLYNVNLLDKENCISSEVVFIKVNDLPHMNLPEQYKLTYADSVILDAGPNMSTYLWSNGDTTQTVTIYGKIVKEGNHTIWAKVSDHNNCIGKDSVLIKVSITNRMITAHGYTHHFYPNPAKNIVKFNYSDLSGQKDLILQIMKSDGVIVFEKTYGNIPEEDIINIASIKAGLYFIKLKIGPEYSIEKLIKLD